VITINVFNTTYTTEKNIKKCTQIVADCPMCSWPTVHSQY